ncbi:hypothetical protein [Acinetobacter bereziniae]|uniref:hypothetical protein n=1 Tax=Acinetobacter bereziniae TaxID=106648 RepID=UPI00124FDFA8|nr:hypothetical protein [Acinetobacter bereziniae]
MNSKSKVMDWSRFTFEEWLKQYGAWISISRMRGGHEPDNLEINQIYWLIRQNDKGIRPNSKEVILDISDFEALQVEQKIYDLKHSITICDSARVCVNLFIDKWVSGQTLDQLMNKMKLSRSSINNMLYAGEFYIAGHDKKLKVKKKLAFKCIP